MYKHFLKSTNETFYGPHHRGAHEHIFGMHFFLTELKYISSTGFWGEQTFLNSKQRKSCSKRLCDIDKDHDKDSVRWIMQI